MPTKIAIKVSSYSPDLWIGGVIDVFSTVHNVEVKYIYVDSKNIDTNGSHAWFDALYSYLDANNIKKFGGKIELKTYCQKQGIPLINKDCIVERDFESVDYLIDLNPLEQVPSGLMSKVSMGILYFTDQRGVAGNISFNETLSNKPKVHVFVNIANPETPDKVKRYKITLKANDISVVRGRYDVMVDAAQFAAFLLNSERLRDCSETIKTDLKLLKFNFFMLFTFLMRSFYLRVRDRIFERVFNQQWRIRIGDLRKSVDYSRLHELLPPKDVFWADPFVVENNGKVYVFCEELAYENNKGHISVLTLDENNKVIENNKIIDEPYHLSYPFVFLHDGKYFMVPESGDNGTVDLYECVNFPIEWKKKRTLIDDIEAYDVTIVKHQDSWWMFASQNTRSGNPNTFLYLYYTDDLFSGSWNSHPMNPIATDVTVARPAGNLYYESDNLIRPSQDCSVAYGWATNKNQIVKMTKEEYEEKLLEKYMPAKGGSVIGQHTFSTNGDKVVVDVLCRRKK